MDAEHRSLVSGKQKQVSILLPYLLLTFSAIFGSSQPDWNSQQRAVVRILTSAECKRVLRSAL